MKKTLARAIACSLQAMRNCNDSGNTELEIKHGDRLHHYETLLPSGAGFDSGTTINLDQSTEEEIVLDTAFHHMTEGMYVINRDKSTEEETEGMYDGWTEHVVTVRPSFVWGMIIAVSGRDRNGIKDYIAETFYECLTAEVEE